MKQQTSQELVLSLFGYTLSSTHYWLSCHLTVLTCDVPGAQTVASSPYCSVPVSVALTLSNCIKLSTRSFSCTTSEWGHCSSHRNDVCTAWEIVKMGLPDAVRLVLRRFRRTGVPLNHPPSAQGPQFGSLRTTPGMRSLASTSLG